MKVSRLIIAFPIVLSCLVSMQMVAAEANGLGNAAEGKVKAVLCSGCHGLNGEGKVMPDGEPAIPLIAGQIPGYFVKVMYDYKTDKRVDPVMNAISKGLTDVDIANLAAYYSGLKAQ
ncbi:MAG: cytochrome c [Chromatiales bacterium]|jgi:cytochrome c553